MPFPATAAAKRGSGRGCGPRPWTSTKRTTPSWSRRNFPGVEKDQISVEVKDGILSLRGERKFEKEVKEESYHRIERMYGSFQRSFSLPVSVDQEKVTAKFKDGVLEVKLPKKEQAKPKQIKVDVVK